jgi:hypothetical protein
MELVATRTVAPADCHLFVPMKDGLRGQHFPDDDAGIAAVRKWVASADADVYARGVRTRVQHSQWW